MGDLSREAILAVNDRKIVAVNLPDWGGIVYVRGMTGAEKDGWEAEQHALSKGGSDRDMHLFRARYLARVLCAADGSALLGKDDVPALAAKSARALDALFEVASPLSGVTAADVRAMLGNSESAPSGASGSGSL